MLDMVSKRVDVERRLGWAGSVRKSEIPSVFYALGTDFEVLNRQGELLW